MEVIGIAILFAFFGMLYMLDWHGAYFDLMKRFNEKLWSHVWSNIMSGDVETIFMTLAMSILIGILLYAHIERAYSAFDEFRKR